MPSATQSTCPACLERSRPSPDDPRDRRLDSQRPTEFSSPTNSAARRSTPIALVAAVAGSCSSTRLRLGRTSASRSSTTRRSTAQPPVSRARLPDRRVELRARRTADALDGEIIVSADTARREAAASRLVGRRRTAAVRDPRHAPPGRLRRPGAAPTAATMRRRSERCLQRLGVESRLTDQRQSGDLPELATEDVAS